jgi:beta-barrel assembly-enhancing protease
MSLVACGKDGALNADKLGDLLGGQAGHAMKAGGHLANAGALSEKDEDALGQSVGLAVTNRYGLYQDEKALKYVTMVGLTVAIASPRPNGNYVFGVLNSADANAFSGPNGYIFVTRGLLLQLADEAELAGVLAHEIAHVCNHDGLHQVQAAETRGAAAELIKAAGSEAQQYATALDQGVDILTKQAYSQPQEYEADAMGLKLMSAAGYDAQSYLRFLQRLAKLEGAASGGRLMSTHPGVSSRIGRVSEQIKTSKPGGATLANRYAAMVAR